MSMYLLLSVYLSLLCQCTKCWNDIFIWFFKIISLCMNVCLFQLYYSWRQSFLHLRFLCDFGWLLCLGNWYLFPYMSMFCQSLLSQSLQPGLQKSVYSLTFTASIKIYQYCVVYYFSILPNYLNVIYCCIWTAWSCLLQQSKGWVVVTNILKKWPYSCSHDKNNPKKQI